MGESQTPLPVLGALCNACDSETQSQCSVWTGSLQRKWEVSIALDRLNDNPSGFEKPKRCAVINQKRTEMEVSYLTVFVIKRLWSLLTWRKRTIIGEWVWIGMLVQCHGLKYSLNKQVRHWGRRMDPSSAHTRGPNSVTLLSPSHSSQARGLKCRWMQRWMTEDCFALCSAEGRVTDIAVWAAGCHLEVWGCKRQHPSISRGARTFVASLLVCACEWMVKCGINSRATCELRKLQQIASALRMTTFVPSQLPW